MVLARAAVDSRLVQGTSLGPLVGIHDRNKQHKPAAADGYANGVRRKTKQDAGVPGDDLHHARSTRHVHHLSIVLAPFPPSSARPPLQQILYAYSLKWTTAYGPILNTH